MLCVCVGDVMDVVFSVCIVRRGAVSSITSLQRPLELSAFSISLYV